MKNVRLKCQISPSSNISANNATRPTSSGFKQQLSPSNNSKGQAKVLPAVSPNISANDARNQTASGFKHQLNPSNNLDDQASGPNINSANDAPNIFDKGLTLTKKYTNQICYNISEVLEYERKPLTKLQLWQNRRARKNTLDKTLVFATKCVLLLLHFELLVNCTNMCVVAQKEVIFNRTQQSSFSDLVKATTDVLQKDFVKRPQILQKHTYQIPIYYYSANKIQFGSALNNRQATLSNAELEHLTPIFNAIVRKGDVFVNLVNTIILKSINYVFQQLEPPFIPETASLTSHYPVQSGPIFSHRAGRLSASDLTPILLVNTTITQAVLQKIEKGSLPAATFKKITDISYVLHYKLMHACELTGVNLPRKRPPLLFPQEESRGLVLDYITNSINDYMSAKGVSARRAKPCLLAMSTYLSLLESEMRIIFNEKSPEVLYYGQARNDIERKVQGFAPEGDRFRREEIELNKTKYESNLTFRNTTPQEDYEASLNLKFNPEEFPMPAYTLPWHLRARGKRSTDNMPPYFPCSSTNVCFGDDYHKVPSYLTGKNTTELFDYVKDIERDLIVKRSSNNPLAWFFGLASQSDLEAEDYKIKNMENLYEKVRKREQNFTQKMKDIVDLYNIQDHDLKKMESHLRDLAKIDSQNYDTLRNNTVALEKDIVANQRLIKNLMFISAIDHQLNQLLTNALSNLDVIDKLTQAGLVPSQLYSGGEAYLVNKPTITFTLKGDIEYTCQYAIASQKFELYEIKTLPFFLDDRIIKYDFPKILASNKKLMIPDVTLKCKNNLCPMHIELRKLPPCLSYLLNELRYKKAVFESQCNEFLVQLNPSENIQEYIFRKNTIVIFTSRKVHLTQTCGEVEKHFETNPGINTLELETDCILQSDILFIDSIEGVMSTVTVSSNETKSLIRHLTKELEANYTIPILPLDLSKLEYTNISNKFQRNQANILHLMKELNATFSWDDLPDFTDPQSPYFRFSIGAAITILSILMLTCCCCCPGPCMKLLQVFCCGKFKVYLDRQLMKMQIRQEAKEREEKDIDQLAEERRSGRPTGRRVRRQESIMSSDSYLPPGDIQRTINSVNDTINNIESRIMRRPVNGQKIFHSQRANYGANDGVNLEMNYVYPANNTLGAARNRALSLSGQRHPPSGIPRHMLQHAQVHVDARPVSACNSFVDIANRERPGQNNLDVARNQQLPYGQIPNAQSSLAINCNQNQVECMSFDEKNIPKINVNHVSSAAPSAPSPSPPAINEDQVDLLKNDDDVNEIANATVLKLLPRTVNTEVGEEATEDSSGVANAMKPLPLPPDHYSQIKSNNEA